MSGQKICRWCQRTKLRESKNGFFCDACQPKAREFLKQLRDLGFVVQVRTGEVLGDHKERGLLTIKETGNITSFGYRTIWDLIQAGRIKTLTLKPGGQPRVPREQIEMLISSGKAITDHLFNLSYAMEILKAPLKDSKSLEEASKIMGNIPFLDETAKLYGFFLKPGSTLITYTERVNVLEGLQLIFSRNRLRDAPNNDHLSQRSVHWLARSKEEEFVSFVKKLYKKEPNPLLRRGMMIGLIFAEVMEPGEFLKTFLSAESNQLLDIYTYQVRSKDVPYPLPHIDFRSIEIGQTFENSIRVLLHEAGALGGKPISLCSLRTLSNILSFGKERALKEFKKAISDGSTGETLKSILCTQNLGLVRRKETARLKQHIRKDSELKRTSAFC